MKKIFILISVIVLFTAGCNKEKPNPIEGAWNLIYAVYVSNDTVTMKYPGDFEGNHMKMWSGEHFIFVGLFRQDTTEFDSYGGGTYTLDGNLYNETIEYHVSGGLVGDTKRMNIRVSNDTLYQVWPVDETGAADMANYKEERYVRLK